LLHDIDVFDLTTANIITDIGVQAGGVPIFFSMVNSPNEQSLVVDGDPPGGGRRREHATRRDAGVQVRCS
jgi:hypothetical protein